MDTFYEVLNTDFFVVRNRKELEFKEHLHKYIEIIYMYSGIQHITIGGVPYEVSAGEAAIIFPGIPHSYHRSGQNVGDHRMIVFDPHYITPLFPEMSGFAPVSPIIPAVDINEETKFAFTNITSDKPIQIKLGYTIIIFSNIYKTLSFTKRQALPLRKLLPQVLSYIDINFASPITRDSLAQEFGVSKYNISRLFSQQLNTNLKTYLNSVRCKKAAELLRTTDFKITAVSQLTGFDSIRSFNRSFKQNFGMSPSELKYTMLIREK